MLTCFAVPVTAMIVSPPIGMPILARGLLGRAARGLLFARGKVELAFVLRELVKAKSNVIGLRGERDGLA